MSIKAYHFWSTTCSPCNAIKPAVQELREEFDSIQWVSVDFTKRNTAPDLPQLEVTKIPTIVVEVKQDDKLVYTESHSGTSIAGYYRILRNAIRQSQK
jgi:thiol-disulfide isomerase/thioredoxin